MPSQRLMARAKKTPAAVPEALTFALEQQEEEARRTAPGATFGHDTRGYASFDALLRGEFDAAAQKAEEHDAPLPPKPKVMFGSDDVVEVEVEASDEAYSAHTALQHGEVWFFGGGSVMVRPPDDSNDGQMSLRQSLRQSTRKRLDMRMEALGKLGVL
eukprot:TRINITY_DN23513_c0_g2_i4.p1 TRINITY_DN23513_c0_g2~~TRINITY_DN23513_c0_g2_i4.p1  ORF type:complete len:158 (-),score=40.41 TRINITY_DN23513_c0_g2_i4:47-520(-)